jgi:hypothetical protein
LASRASLKYRTLRLRLEASLTLHITLVARILESGIVGVGDLGKRGRYVDDIHFGNPSLRVLKARKAFAVAIQSGFL